MMVANSFPPAVNKIRENKLVIDFSAVFNIHLQLVLVSLREISITSIHNCLLKKKREVSSEVATTKAS